MGIPHPFPDSLTLDNVLFHFSSDEKAREFLEGYLWKDGPTCPRCEGREPTVYKMAGTSGRPGLYNCRACHRQFTVTVGTVFASSHIPLRKWLIAWFLMCSSKKGTTLPGMQWQRLLDLGSYRTVLFMKDRLRRALKRSNFYIKRKTRRRSRLRGNTVPPKSKKKQPAHSGINLAVSPSPPP